MTPVHSQDLQREEPSTDTQVKYLGPVLVPLHLVSTMTFGSPKEKWIFLLRLWPVPRLSRLTTTTRSTKGASWLSQGSCTKSFSNLLRVSSNARLRFILKPWHGLIWFLTRSSVRLLFLSTLVDYRNPNFLLDNCSLWRVLPPTVFNGETSTPTSRTTLVHGWTKVRKPGSHSSVVRRDLQCRQRLQPQRTLSGR